MIRLTGFLALFASAALMLVLSTRLSHEDYRMTFLNWQDLRPEIGNVMAPTRVCHLESAQLSALERDDPPGSTYLILGLPESIIQTSRIGDRVGLCDRGFRVPLIRLYVERCAYRVERDGVTHDIPAGPLWPVYTAYAGLCAAPIVLWVVAAGIAALAAGRRRPRLDS